MTDIACGLTSQERLQYSGRLYPACVPEDETAVIAYAATVVYYLFLHEDTSGESRAVSRTVESAWRRPRTWTLGACLDDERSASGAVVILVKEGDQLVLDDASNEGVR